MGVALLKGDTAYLCATDPADFLGMAQPVRIQQRTGTLKMEEIVEDIFKLSYMNVHAINKSRLPVTVNYADKSSTFLIGACYRLMLKCRYSRYKGQKH